MTRIYLDHNASTPIAAEAAAAMQDFLVSGWGNPSSPHWAGRPARDAVERARGEVAGLLECEPAEIVFTSGGSEANNHAIKGVYYAWLRARGRTAADPPHFVTSAVEHPAVLEPLRFLEALGAEVTVLPVDRWGRVDPEAVARALTPRTLLVSIMHANNEVGTIQPIAEISKIARERGVLVHTDAAQSAGKIPVQVRDMGVDLLTIAGHKLYAPKGVGALYIRSGIFLEPLIHGAGHEGGRRAGTENVLLAIGLGKACALTTSDPKTATLRALRDRFEDALLGRVAGVSVNGHPEQRLPNTSSVNFAGKIGAEVLAALDGVAASTGSACHAGQVTLSPVLKAMGVPPDIGIGAVRFSLGRGTRWEELEEVLRKLEAELG